MKRITGWTVVVVLIGLILGCGGGGGGSSSGGGTTGTTYHDAQITAYTPGQTEMLDTRNILVGDTLQLEITARDKNDNLVVVPISGWSTNAPANVATVTSAGVLTGIGASGATVYQISVVYAGAKYSASLIVSAPQDIVTGLVRNTSNPIENVIVDFYNGSGVQVGASYTARDGTFRASVPSTATNFTLDMSQADPGAVYYYLQFAYGDLEYLEETSCLAPLPATLSATVPTALPNPIVPNLKNGVPPPPPTGCIG